MTTWTEAQIDRHLHLWEHRHGPDSPEAGIVRQLRAERDIARESAADYSDIPDTPEQRAFIAQHNEEMKRRHPNLKSIYPTTQETPHE